MPILGEEERDFAQMSLNRYFPTEKLFLSSTNLFYYNSNFRIYFGDFKLLSIFGHKILQINEVYLRGGFFKQWKFVHNWFRKIICVFKHNSSGLRMTFVKGMGNVFFKYWQPKVGSKPLVYTNSQNQSDFCCSSKKDRKISSIFPSDFVQSDPILAVCVNRG
jgi:hypothetical protein